VYAKKSAGSERAQMARDLSVNGKEGAAHELFTCHKEPAFQKTQFYEIGTFPKSASFEQAQRRTFVESSVLPAQSAVRVQNHQFAQNPLNF